MTSPPLWARDLLERLLRNVVQALTPALLLLSASGDKPDLLGMGGMLLAVVVFTVLKYLVGGFSTAGSPLWQQVLDRVLSASAASVLTFLPAQWDGSLSSVDWGAAGWSALGAAVLAVLMFYGAPPSQTVRSDLDLAA